MDNNTVYEWLLLSTFTVSARTDALEKIASNLSELVQPGNRILDLCCGSGFVSFWLEERGAIVTGMDFAPYMIALAKEEAERRNSRVDFIEGNIFTRDFGLARFDLITCFGNSISDFPLSDFEKLGGKIAGALKPGGRLALEYEDGFYNKNPEHTVREGVHQETPERITFRFKEYLPEIGASVATMRNVTRGEEYDRKSYMYTPPMVELAMSNHLPLEQRVKLDMNQFLDIYIKTE